MSERKLSKKKSVFILSTILVLIIAVFCILLLGKHNHIEEPAPVSVASEFEFTSLANPDSTKYITVISPTKTVDILFVAEHFYQHKDYWSYIFRDNNLENPLSIPAGTVIKIPIVDSIGHKNSLAKAKLLGDSLLEKHSATKRD